MSKNILILAEYRDGKLDGITLQLLVKGRQMADKMGGLLQALLIGSGLNNVAQSLAVSGADEVIAVENPLLEKYNPEVYLNIISEQVKKLDPTLFLIGHSYLGMELGPALAVRLGLPLLTNCVEIEMEPENIYFTRPMFGGTAHARYSVGLSRPVMATIQRGAFSSDVAKSPPGRIIKVAAVVAAPGRTEVIEIIKPAESEIDITKADILVSVGRGIKDKANIGLAQDLASALGGVVSCSRPIADLGWLPVETHVGISGKTVRPKVYLAWGISGAAQHIAAMRDSRVIIAINNDANAPIFNIAHYGVVGDLFEIIPVMTAEAGKKE